MKVNLKKVLRYKPEAGSWPTTKENYFSLRDLPFLKKFINYARCHGASNQELLDAWEGMLACKAQAQQTPINKKERLSLTEAFCLLFQTKSYNYTKKCYAALLQCVAE